MSLMVLRFFFYIWGAILGTALLVISLTISFDPPPPGHVPVDAVLAPMQAAAREAFLQEGRAGVDALLAQEESLARYFALVDASGVDCAAPETIGVFADGSCLKMQAEASRFLAFGQLVPFLMPMLIGAAISLFIALVLAQRFVRPIQRLGLSLTALSRGDLHQRIGPALDRTEPAIADVGKAFDLAASKLQELTESRSRLFHDISHEIRSPLARLQVEIALLRQNPARLEAMLPRMDADVARMDHLVGEILTLARLERGGASAFTPVSIDLIDVLDPILRDFELEGQARGIRLNFTGPDRQDLVCDPELLHRAFENILRNALRYSPDGGTVDMTITPTPDCIKVAISDLGPGIDEAQIPTIFQAFVRDEAGGGAGLGLAIAANAIRLHGGTIRAENRQGGGLDVSCLLPRGRHAGAA